MVFPKSSKEKGKKTAAQSMDQELPSGDLPTPDSTGPASSTTSLALDEHSTPASDSEYVSEPEGYPVTEPGPPTPTPTRSNFPTSVRGHVDTAPARALNTWPFRQHLIDPEDPTPGAFTAEIHASGGHASEGLFHRALHGLADALSALPQAVGSFQASIPCPRCFHLFEIGFSTMVNVSATQPKVSPHVSTYKGEKGGYYCSKCKRVKKDDGRGPIV